jgi:hypothetical protein
MSPGPRLRCASCLADAGPPALLMTSRGRAHHPVPDDPRSQRRVTATACSVVSYPCAVPFGMTAGKSHGERKLLLGESYEHS